MEEFSDPMQYLLSLDFTEWPNIPKPLLFSLISIKQCIVLQSTKITEFAKKMIMVEAGVGRRFEEFDSRLTNLNNMLISVDEGSKERNKEFSKNIYSEIAAFKSDLSKDNDFKTKSTDTKINNMQETIFQMKKTLSALPFMTEVEQIIKQSSNDLRTSLRKDIIDNIVSPEVNTINTKINNGYENHDIYITKLQENVEVLKLNFQVFGEQSNEKYITFEKVISGIENDNEKKKAEIAITLKSIEIDQGLLQSKTMEKTDAITNFTKELGRSIREIEGKYKESQENIRKVSEELVALQQEISKGKQIQEEEKNKKVKKVKKAKNEVKKTKGNEKVEAKFEKDKSASRVQVDETVAYKEILIETHDLPKIPNNLPHKDSTKAQKFDDLYKRLQLFDEKLQKLSTDTIPIHNNLKNDKMELEVLIKDVKEKLSWLPMNLNHLKGKPPNEARLFTLEARLRMEENLRVEQYNKLFSFINQLKPSTFTENSPTMPSVFPQITTSRHTAMNFERKPSSATLNSSDLHRSLNDSDLKTNALDMSPIAKFSRHPQHKLSLDPDQAKRMNFVFKKTH